MKLYLWENVFSDYTPGVAFALAESEEQARELAIAAYERNVGGDGDWARKVAMEKLAGKPRIVKGPFGFQLSGGG